MVHNSLLPLSGTFFFNFEPKLYFGKSLYQYNFSFSFRKCSFQHCDYHFMEIRKPCTYISSVLKTIATVSYEKVNTTWIIHVFKTCISPSQIFCIKFFQEVLHAGLNLLHIEVTYQQESKPNLFKIIII